MKIINDPLQIQSAILKLKLNEQFDTSKYQFQIHEYSKSEMVVSPYKGVNGVYFCLSGSARIYNITQDAALVEVQEVKPGTILGDMEFTGAYASKSFVEAYTTFRCLALVKDGNYPLLYEDPHFLMVLLKSVVDKMAHIDLPSIPIKERVINYMKQDEKHQLRGINSALYALHCSRRQLQRILKDLTEKGEVIKVSKGVYQLINL